MIFPAYQAKSEAHRLTSISNYVKSYNVCPRLRAITKLHMAADSSCSNRLPCLKFVGDKLSVSTLISLVTLTFDLLTSNLVRVIARGVVNLPSNLGVSGTSRSRLMDRQLSEVPRGIATLTFNLGGHGACR